MEELLVPIVVATISSGLLTVLVTKTVGWVSGRSERRENAYTQRDHQRDRADLLHRRLVEHQTWCHMEHVYKDSLSVIPFSDMPGIKD